jgi:hypothetical protein
VIARQALEFHASAARDHIRLRPGNDGAQADRDVTVNRAFSRKFFEALEQGLPELARGGLVALDEVGSTEVFEEDIEAELDEADLIQT